MTEEPKKEEEKAEDPKDKEIRELTEKLHKSENMNRFLSGYLSNLGLDLLNIARNAMKETPSSK